jgi:SAM-dependent methyltransferase
MDNDSTIKVQMYRDSTGAPDLSGAYRGLRIHALGGLHEFVAGRVLASVPAGAELLDLAAGTGAMSLRLRDLGYAVTATDYVAENFRLHTSIPFFRADLNGNFSDTREATFDAIVAAEIIEHLENPRHFARQCGKLLRSGGKLILSTPNVDNLASVVKFLRYGSFQWFGDFEYEHDGHITPLTQWQLAKCFEEAGFAFLWRGSFGNRDDVFKPSRRSLLLRQLLRLFTPGRGELGREIFVAVLEKPAPSCLHMAA